MFFQLTVMIFISQRLRHSTLAIISRNIFTYIPVHQLNYIRTPSTTAPL